DHAARHEPRGHPGDHDPPALRVLLGAATGEQLDLVRLLLGRDHLAGHRDQRHLEGRGAQVDSQDVAVHAHTSNVRSRCAPSIACTSSSGSDADMPYTGAIPVLTPGFARTSATDSRRSARNRSATPGRACRSVTAMCTAAGRCSPFRLQPRLPMFSSTWNTSRPSSVVNAITHSGSPSTRSPGISAMPSRTLAPVSRIRRAASVYPRSPMDTIAAQHVADSAPGRLPANVGDRYRPPGQSAVV